MWICLVRLPPKLSIFESYLWGNCQKSTFNIKFRHRCENNVGQNDRADDKNQVAKCQTDSIYKFFSIYGWVKWFFIACYGIVQWKKNTSNTKTIDLNTPAIQSAYTGLWTFHFPCTKSLNEFHRLERWTFLWYS